MKRRHLIAAAGLVAAVVGGLTALGGGHADPVVVESSPETSTSIAALLDHVSVVDAIDKHRGYQRGCKKGQAPLTEPTAQSAQV